MPTYWLIKAVLILALFALGALIIRPVRSASHLAMRRLGVVLIMIFAGFAVLFPHVLNDLASLLGVERGINLLVYTLVLAFFMQMATTYRRDADAEQRITQLARAVAISSVQVPTTTENAHHEATRPKTAGDASAPEISH